MYYQDLDAVTKLQTILNFIEDKDEEIEEYFKEELGLDNIDFAQIEETFEILIEEIPESDIVI